MQKNKQGNNIWGQTHCVSGWYKIISKDLDLNLCVISLPVYVISEKAYDWMIIY